MKWEERELIIILSSRLKHRIKTQQQCEICKLDLSPGDVCASFGMSDRKYETRRRIYTCLDHREIFNYDSIEDLEEWQQAYLYENRYAREVWYQE